MSRFPRKGHRDNFSQTWGLKNPHLERISCSFLFSAYLKLCTFFCTLGLCSRHCIWITKLASWVHQQIPMKYHSVQMVDLKAHSRYHPSHLAPEVPHLSSLALSSLKSCSTMQFVCILQKMKLKTRSLMAQLGNFRTGILASWQHITF